MEVATSVPDPNEGTDKSLTISSNMSTWEIIALLTKHKCPDVTKMLDLERCGKLPISSGGFGDIYQGTLVGGEKVAIKCPRLYHNYNTIGYLKDAARELYSWSSLKHTNIVELIGLAQFRGQLAMVSPWMENGPLPEYIARHPDVDRYQLCCQIATGLAYLHEKGIVHGDIKGLNVLISREGVAKLTDFGNSVLKNCTLQFTGTTSASNFSLRWTAPEILGGTTNKYSEKADVYALAMTILEIITGQVPFHGKLDPVVYGDVVVRQRIPERPLEFFSIKGAKADALWELMIECWNRDSAARPDSASVLEKLRRIDQNPSISPDLEGAILWVANPRPNRLTHSVGITDQTPSQGNLSKGIRYIKDQGSLGPQLGKRVRDTQGYDTEDAGPSRTVNPGCISIDRSDKTPVTSSLVALGHKISFSQHLWSQRHSDNVNSTVYVKVAGERKFKARVEGGGKCGLDKGIAPGIIFGSLRDSLTDGNVHRPGAMCVIDIKPLKFPRRYQVKYSSEDYRVAAVARRKPRLQRLWGQLPPAYHTQKNDARVVPTALTQTGDPTPEFAAQSKQTSTVELVGQFRDVLSVSDSDGQDLEVDQGKPETHVKAEDTGESDKALYKADRNTFANFTASSLESPHSQKITFSEFRKILELFPRKFSPQEMYQLYKFLGGDIHGPVYVNMEGDARLSAWDRPPATRVETRANTHTVALPAPPAAEDVGPPRSRPLGTPEEHESLSNEEKELDKHEAEESNGGWLGGEQALKFLGAGGLAGSVSRTVTAPFERVRFFLMTRQTAVTGNLKQQVSPTNLTRATGRVASVTTSNTQTLGRAVVHLYAEGGLRAFWVGNGLHVFRIFPESATKFLSYETSKRFFAQYIDGVEDSRNISGASRFVSGGIGGMTSQLSIYPIETVRTQMMSTVGQQQSILPALKRLWAMGGMRAYYRGFTLAVVGVFPYSGIDLCMFETLKFAYARAKGTTEVGVFPLLVCGSISGSVGATAVYPLNLIRARLQSSGSSGHPQLYVGIRDAAWKTMKNEGWRGFYKGLVPTLAKVVPAVSVSYVVYEKSKRMLGV